MSAVVLQGDLSIQCNADNEFKNCAGLSLYKEDNNNGPSTDGQKLGRFLVQFDLLRVVPFTSVKKYLFTNSRWRVYTEPGSEELSILFKKTFQCHPLLPSGVTRWTMLVKVREHSSLFLKTTQLDNPFVIGKDADEFAFPLPSTSHFLIYGEKLPESPSLCILASLLHEPNEFINIFHHISPFPLHQPGNIDTLQTLEKSMEKIYHRSGLKHLALTALSGRSKKSKANTEKEQWEFIRALDKIREENSKTIPERQIVKNKPSKQKRVTMIAVPTAVIGDKQGPGSSGPSREGTLEPEEASSSGPLEKGLRNDRSASPIAATSAPDIKIASSAMLPTPETTTPRRKDEPIEAENKKVLKKLVWDKLLRRGYVKREDDTKAYYHQIYQSSQFVLRHGIKQNILSAELMDTIAEKHFDFYASMQGVTNTDKTG